MSSAFLVSTVAPAGLRGAPTAASLGASALTPGAESELKAAARDVVNVTFLSVLMKAMRKTQREDGLLHGGPGERVFRQQLDVVLIDRMSRSLSTPLADAIVRQAGPQKSPAVSRRRIDDGQGRA